MATVSIKQYDVLKKPGGQFAQLVENGDFITFIDTDGVKVEVRATNKRALDPASVLISKQFEQLETQS